MSAASTVLVPVTLPLRSLTSTSLGVKMSFGSVTAAVIGSLFSASTSHAAIQPAQAMMTDRQITKVKYISPPRMPVRLSRRKRMGW